MADKLVARRLSPEEAALWRRVAAGVRALKPAPPVPVVEAQPPRLVPTVLTKSKIAQVVPTPRAATAVKVKPNSQTLDGSWDKRIGAGRIIPEMTIDLHGYTAAAAHQRLEHGLGEAIRDGVRVILLVTGRAPRRDVNRMDLPLRGIIRSSIGDWLAASRHAGAIAAVRNAHPKHGGAGALYIVLRRNR